MAASTCCLRKAGVDAFVDVDAFDGAAGLAGVVKGAVDAVVDRVLKLGVGADVGGVFAAEFEADVDEPIDGAVDDFVAAADGPGEGDVVDTGVADEFVGDGVAGDDVLHEIRRCAGLGEGVDEGLAARWSLARMLDDDAVAGEDAGDDHVDGDEQRVVPRDDVEHDAEGLVANVFDEVAVFGEVLLGEGGVGNGYQVFGAGDHGAHLALGLRQRFTHLLGHLRGNVIGHGAERLKKLRAERLAIGQGRVPPAFLGLAGLRDDGVDVGLGQHGKTRDDIFGEGIDNRQFVCSHGW